MNKISNILVIVDPTAIEHPAVDKAAILAARFGARLELYICDTKESRQARMATQLAKSPPAPLLVDMKPMLESLARPLRSRGIDVATEVEAADPLHTALLERLKRSSADLVVKDTHHHSIAKRTFITNTDWHLIRGCPVPLLLAKAGKWHDHPTLLAAVDPGHADDKPAQLDHRILELATRIAKHLDGTTHAVHAYMPMAIVAAATAGAPPMAGAISAEALAQEDAAKRKDLQTLTQPYGIEQRHLHVDIGAPGEYLPRIAAELHADIAVMGAISRSALKRAFIGNTAERVLERLPCDALVVKPPSFAEAMSF